MTERLSFDALRDNVVDNQVFQAACQRYAHGNGSSEAIAMAVLTAIGFPDLYLDALRYRFLRTRCVRLWESSMGGPDTCDLHFEGDGRDVDAAIDAAMTSGIGGKAGA